MKNIVKVLVKEKLKEGIFSEALDFLRVNPGQNHKTYHHVGIYAFTNKALLRYVGLKRSKLEIERKLEQLRALENKIPISVYFTKSKPIGVDTPEDFKKVKKLMEKKNNII